MALKDATMSLNEAGHDISHKVAVIGSGVSGLACAWLLSDKYEVTLFEADPRIGGHCNTVDVDDGAETVSVDTGFIVFNEKNYKNLTQWLRQLGVLTEQSCMSFGVSLDEGNIEYSGQTISSIFANRKSIFSTSHWKMLTEVLRFHRLGKQALCDGDGQSNSLADFINKNNFSEEFVQRFLNPMAAAIWSSPGNDVLQYSSHKFFQFFNNHGLLQVTNLPVWHTISGGSRQYVQRVESKLGKNVYPNTPVKSVSRQKNGVVLRGATGELGAYGQVVMACHADSALKLLEAPSAREQELLSAFSYQRNEAVLHFDPELMPKRRRAWSSWNFLGKDGENTVTYWMNRLQNLKCEKDIFVSLNPQKKITGEHYVASFQYDHPVFNVATARAQQELWGLQGRGGVWYCGAYFGHGFHEDGLQAGLAVAEELGTLKRPWDVEGENDRLSLNKTQTPLVNV